VHRQSVCGFVCKEEGAWKWRQSLPHVRVYKQFQVYFMLDARSSSFAAWRQDHNIHRNATNVSYGISKMDLWAAHYHHVHKTFSKGPYTHMHTRMRTHSQHTRSYLYPPLC
jgi:hypothetical protein